MIRLWILKLRSNLLIHFWLDVRIFSQAQENPFEVGQGRVEAGPEQIALQVMQLGPAVDNEMIC